MSVTPAVKAGVKGMKAQQRTERQQLRRELKRREEGYGAAVRGGMSPAEAAQSHPLPTREDIAFALGDSYTPEEIEIEYQQVQAGAAASEKVGEWTWGQASNEDINSDVQQMAPDPSDPNYATLSKIYGAVQKAAQGVINERATDPAGHVLKYNSALRDRIANERDPGKRIEAHEDLVQAQRDIGIPEDALAPLPKQEIDSLIQMVNDPERPPEDKMRAIAGMVGQVGTDPAMIYLAHKAMEKAGVDRNLLSASNIMRRSEGDAFAIARHVMNAKEGATGKSGGRASKTGVEGKIMDAVMQRGQRGWLAFNGMTNDAERQAAQAAVQTISLTFNSLEQQNSSSSEADNLTAAIDLYFGNKSEFGVSPSVTMAQMARDAFSSEFGETPEPVNFFDKSVPKGQMLSDAFQQAEFVIVPFPGMNRQGSMVAALQVAPELFRQVHEVTAERMAERGAEALAQAGKENAAYLDERIKASPSAAYRQAQVMSVGNGIALYDPLSGSFFPDKDGRVLIVPVTGAGS